MAVQGVVGGWGGWGGGGLGLSADYLFEMPTLAETEPLDIAWNIGPGLGVGLFPAADIVGVAASGVLGLELGFNPVPIDIVLEYRPTVLVVPAVAFDFVNISGHVRWFF